MSQAKVKDAVIAGAVLATSLAVRDSIYSALRNYFPLPEDEFYANLVTALITIILLVLVLWLSTFYETPEEKMENQRREQKLENHKKLMEVAERQKEIQEKLTLRLA